MKNPVTTRRCKRCGAIAHHPYPDNLCPNCTKWTEKKK